MDDALCGGGDPQMGIMNTSATIAQFNIKAVLLPGDDRFTVGEPFHVGNATKPGLYPRPNDQLRCGKYTDAIQLYCDADDEYCASGSSLLVHLSYYLRYKDTGLDFIKSRLGHSCH
nr:acetylxylan esterase 2 [Quercus suber]